MFGVEGIWLALFILALVAMTVFIWYFSRGTDWMMTEEELNEKYSAFDNDDHSVVY